MDDFSLGSIKLQNISVGQVVETALGGNPRRSGSQIFKSFSENDLIKLPCLILSHQITRCVKGRLVYFLLIYCE